MAYFFQSHLKYLKAWKPSEIAVRERTSDGSTIGAGVRWAQIRPTGNVFIFIGHFPYIAGLVLSVVPFLDLRTFKFWHVLLGLALLVLGPFAVRLSSRAAFLWNKWVFDEYGKLTIVHDGDVRKPDWMADDIAGFEVSPIPTKGGGHYKLQTIGAAYLAYDVDVYLNDGRKFEVATNLSEANARLLVRQLELIRNASIGLESLQSDTEAQLLQKRAKF
jgi:hypothetical protein